MNRVRLLPPLLLIGLTSCSKPPAAPTEEKATAPSYKVGGADVITLHRNPEGDAIQFTGADILPGRGWNTYQIRAMIPGHGETALLEAPALDQASALLNGGPEDRIGNKSFSVGGAILIPYANRVTGKLTADKRDITAQVGGQTVTLPANWGGKKPGAAQYAMHGLILDSKINPRKVTADSAEGTLDAGDFQGRWVGNTQLEFRTALKKDAFTLEVIAKNTGQRPIPLGIGWHPYFVVPSGKREQATLHLPATERAPANNYDEVLPTGKIAKTARTPYDFTAPGGRAMGKLFLDDSFTGLTRSGENAVAEIRDPATRYGLRIIAETPQIQAFQVYAPPERQIIVVEPQFNLADPFGKEWKNHPTGMVMLAPGDVVTYRVRLELFQP